MLSELIVKSRLRDSSLTSVCLSLSNSTGLLLLCEVAAKPFHEEKNANYNADRDCKTKKKLSVSHLLSCKTQ